jgi:hypothetical protein
MKYELYDDMMYSLMFKLSMAKSHTAQLHLVNVFCRAGSGNFLNTYPLKPHFWCGNTLGWVVLVYGIVWQEAFDDVKDTSAGVENGMYKGWRSDSLRQVTE